MEDTQGTEDSGVEMRYDHLYKSKTLNLIKNSHLSWRYGCRKIKSSF